MKHYVCAGGCDSQSDKPGVCESEFCTSEGEPLKPCDCEDGMHEAVINGEDAEPSDDGDEEESSDDSF